MEKIRIQRNEDELYHINISDDGQEIILDPLSIDFPIKLENAIKSIDKNLDILKQKISLAERKEDGNYGIIKAYSEYNRKNREIVDDLFGEGTCYALFQDKNYVGMFNDLFIELSPHLEKVYKDVNPILEKVKRKYSKKDSDTLE